MPAYDFKCTECAGTFEVVRPMNLTGDESCPECGAVATKVFSPVGVSFKGSGFHNTDYRSGPSDSDGSSADAPACSSGACPGCCGS
jgi:putative FmdB family regulatory protein